MESNHGTRSRNLQKDKQGPQKRPSVTEPATSLRLSCSDSKSPRAALSVYDNIYPTLSSLLPPNCPSQFGLCANSHVSRMTSTDPLDVSEPPIDGLSHLTLVAPNADLFYSTIQFYESLGFQAVCLVRPSPIALPHLSCWMLFNLLG